MQKQLPYILLLFTLFLTFNSYGQIFQPVKWKFTSKHIKGQEHELIFEATMDEGWAIYGNKLERDDGPRPTVFTFDELVGFKLKGDIIEDKLNRKNKYDALFDMKVIKFTKKAIFRQRIIGDGTGVIKGYLNFMTCDDQRCLPPEDIDFAIEISKPVLKEEPKKTPPASAKTTQQAKEKKKKTPDKIAKTTQRPPTLKPKISEQKTKEQAVVATEAKVEKATKAAAPTRTFKPTNIEEKLYGITPLDLNRPINDCSTSAVAVEEESSILGILLLGILGGLLALLTPCVFPMIPLTVSFFTKSHTKDKGKGMRDSMLYGFFIFMVYALLSVPFHLLDSVNPDILNEISTNAWLNIAFFVIFLFFAFSFFGYYELTLPTSWTSKASSAEGVGGILGIFFMALTLALVSFSCTGPILGSLLAGAMSSKGGAWQLTAGMSGFGLALALPFALFAMFPGWMNKLPKSGGWLNSVKVVLGFLELALALKFLSNADLVEHWGILKIEPFLILWILIFAGLAFYLFGKIKFPHDSPIQKLSPLRLGLGVLSLGFSIYLATGFMYDEAKKSFSPLTLLSGLAPPVGYSWIYPKDCPNNLDCFKDFNEGLAYAKQHNKPIMIDFTGYACVNCRKMEEHVWPKKQIFDYIDKDYVLISLYVDDKKALPESEQIEVERVQGGKRKLRNYGHKWAHFQTKYFATNSQPYYVLLSPDGEKLLNKPVGYTPDIEEYANFLECGKSANNRLSDSN